MRTIMILILASISFGSLSSFASFDACGTATNQYLSRAGITDAIFEYGYIIPAGRAEENRRYEFRYHQPSCEGSGSIIITTNTACAIVRACSWHDCNPPGIPHCTW